MLWYLSGGWLWWETCWLHMNRDPGHKPTGSWFVFGGYAASFFHSSFIIILHTPFHSLLSFHLLFASQPLYIIRFQLRIGALYQSHYVGYLWCRFHLTLWNALTDQRLCIVLTFILFSKQCVHCSEALRESFIWSVWLKINVMGLSHFSSFTFGCFVFYAWNKSSGCN